MHTTHARKFLLGFAALSLMTPLGCAKNSADTVPPGAERGGAGADGNNSAPESLSNGGADPDTTPMTEPSTAAPQEPLSPPPATPEAASQPGGMSPSPPK